MTASYALDQDVAVITVENPPVNALSHATRAGHHGRAAARARPTTR